MAARNGHEDQFELQESHLSRYVVSLRQCVPSYVRFFTGSNKPKKLEELRKYDIILTTYQVGFDLSSFHVFIYMFLDFGP